MSIHRDEQFSATWNQVAAFRLARRHLLERTSPKNLLEEAQDLGRFLETPNVEVQVS